MALSRGEVFDVIDAERNYQDNLWPPHDGHKRGEHLMSLIHVYVRKAEEAWNAGDSLNMWRQLAKIAACVSRALESGDTDELKKGLR